MSALNPGYFTETELRELGFRSVGENARIQKHCVVIGEQNIVIGNNVRIDGYTTIVAAGEGWLELGSYIHIGSYCLLSAGAGIRMSDFSGLSQGVRLYSRSDDYSGEYLTNPTVPEAYTGVASGQIRLGRHVIVGSGAVVLPGVELGEGSAVGALSLVTKSLAPWGIYAGAPATRRRDRSQHLLELEKKLATDAP